MPTADLKHTIAHTEQWIKDVVIGCNFCPFAAKPFLQKRIRYQVVNTNNIDTIKEILKQEFIFLDAHETIETTFIILETCYDDFNTYLSLVSKAEKILHHLHYEGVFQLASFHPLYCFEHASVHDAENYTNRSPYPMLHILREKSISAIADTHYDTDNIPAQNIAYTQHKGLAYMQALLKNCMP